MVEPLKGKGFRFEDPEESVKFTYDDILSAVNWLKKELDGCGDSFEEYKTMIKKIDEAFYDVTTN